MTLIIGIKCNDGIILASDSQTTYGTSKQLDSVKMESIYFGNDVVVVAQAGSILMSGRFLDILKQHAKSVCGSPTPIEIAVAAQTAMRELRSELRGVHFGCSSEELNDILLRQGTECEVMLGFYVNDLPHVYTVDLRNAVYQKAPSYFDAIGCGAPLGKYLLTEHSTRAMDKRMAAVMAIYTIEIVKKHDAFCGGPTKVSIIQRDAQKRYCEHGFLQEQIDAVAQKLFSAEAVMKPQLIKILHEEILSQGFKPMEVLDFDFIR